MDEERTFIHKTLSIPDREFRFSFSRSSGPGGQNVNKVNTKAELRFCLADSPTLTETQKKKIRASLGRRVTKEGEVVIVCGRHRSREQNRQECLDRFAKLLQNALRRKKTRVATRPSKASKEKRLKEKRMRSDRKRGRGRVRDDG